MERQLKGACAIRWNMPVPKHFDYYAPSSVDEALSLTKRFGDEGKILAGGQSLLPMMKFRLISPKAVIDIHHKLRKHLSYIREDGNKIAIGALTTHDDVLASKRIRKSCPVLARAAEHIGDRQVRNRGTIGGSLCHADPAAHYSPAILALNAEFVIRGPKAERTVGAGKFLVDMLTTALKKNEILVEIKIPKCDGFGWGYEVVQRRSGDFASAIATVLLKMKGKICEDARIVIGATTPVPVEMKEAEKLLQGRNIDKSLIEKAGARVYEDLPEPMADIRAGSEYKREVARVLTERALQSATGGV